MPEYNLYYRYGNYVITCTTNGCAYEHIRLLTLEAAMAELYHLRGCPQEGIKIL